MAADRLSEPDEGCQAAAESLADEPIDEDGQIHAALSEHPGGLTRSQISQTPNHNQTAGQIDHALHALHTAGRVIATRIPTGGRPAQLWTATPPPSA